MNQKVKFVALEGNTGCGKSTVLEFLSTLPAIEVRPEPVKTWQDFHGLNLLQLKHRDPQRWFYTFQTMVQLTRLQMYAPSNDQRRIRVMERSLHSNRYCFLEVGLQSKHLTEAEYALSTEWFQFLETNFKIDLDLIIYLRTSPQIAFERVKQRNRVEEKEVTLEQLEQCHNLYENWITAHSCKFPVAVVNADADVRQVNTSVASLLHSVFKTSPSTPC